MKRAKIDYQISLPYSWDKIYSMAKSTPIPSCFPPSSKGAYTDDLLRDHIPHTATNAAYNG